MNYAVFKAGGRQFKVKEGDIVEIDHLLSADKNITFDQVLMQSFDGKVKIGNPTLYGAMIKATVLEQKKGKKIKVAKFKSKVRYRRAVGFRSQITVLKIESLGSS